MNLYFLNVKIKVTVKPTRKAMIVKKGSSPS